MNGLTLPAPDRERVLFHVIVAVGATNRLDSPLLRSGAFPPLPRASVLGHGSTLSGSKELLPDS